jgi:outer membrane protein OmpA-like peptidoglycan-associated protein
MQRKPLPRTAAAAVVAAGLLVTGAPSTHADTPTATETPAAGSTSAGTANGVAAASSAPPTGEDTPGEDTSAPVEVDPNAPGLKLMGGAKLAAPKVLDIKTVVENGSGDERRSETNKDVTFALQTQVLFTKDSSKLSSAALGRIQAIADEIDDQNAKEVKVFGFTDNLGSSSHGVTLSRQRAEAVRRALAKNLSPDVSYDVRGYGEDFPIADNSTEAGRKKNRRVEISFPKTED